jgi:hypothetical protein
MGHIDAAWTEDAWYGLDRELPVIAAVKGMGPEPEPPPPPLPLDETLRSASWSKRGLAYNPKAAFATYARQHDLGPPLTNEFDVAWHGKTYRVQGFAGSIVYSEVGDWTNIKRVSW